MRIAFAAAPSLSFLPLPFARRRARLPGTRNPAAISGGTYNVDTRHTLVPWTVDRLGPPLLRDLR